MTYRGPCRVGDEGVTGGRGRLPGNNRGSHSRSGQGQGPHHWSCRVEGQVTRRPTRSETSVLRMSDHLVKEEIYLSCIRKGRPPTL